MPGKWLKEGTKIQEITLIIGHCHLCSGERLRVLKPGELVPAFFKCPDCGKINHPQAWWSITASELEQMEKDQDV